MHGVKTKESCTRACGDTNLQIPVDDAINMAVMDTLQDLLYAVAEGRRVMNMCRIVMEQMEGETQRQDRKVERKRREGKLIEKKRRGNNLLTMYHMVLSLDFL